MSYQHKCTQCDFESNDKLSVEMCEKRHNCTREDHPQNGLIFDLKVTNTKCECGKETPEVRELTDEQRQIFISEVMKIVPLTDLIKRYYQE